MYLARENEIPLKRFLLFLWDFHFVSEIHKAARRAVIFDLPENRGRLQLTVDWICCGKVFKLSPGAIVATGAGSCRPMSLDKFRKA